MYFFLVGKCDAIKLAVFYTELANELLAIMSDYVTPRKSRSSSLRSRVQLALFYIIINYKQLQVDIYQSKALSPVNLFKKNHLSHYQVHLPSTSYLSVQILTKSDYPLRHFESAELKKKLCYVVETKAIRS